VKITDSHLWHNLSAEDVLAQLETDLKKGLAAAEIEHRRSVYGSNVLTAKKQQSAIIKFWLQFHQPLIYILLAASLIAALLHEWVDAGVIFGVVLVNAIVGFMQESKALKAIEALARSMTSQATVIRDGDKQRIDSVELVPGDIVNLQSGDKVPADLRLIDCHELQIDESALTGESVPVEKTVDSLTQEVELAERKNMGYSSTLITYGAAVGIVVGTGQQTEVGRISEMIKTAEILATPLTRKIARFSHILLYVILGMAAVTFLVGILRGQSWIDMFMAAVALAVGAIPEGLPAALTITLAIGVARMAKRHAIIRKLPAVETLGSTTVICSDKTGTLTQNQMTVQQIQAGDNLYHVTGTGYEPKGEFTINEKAVDLKTASTLMECLQAGMLCNDSDIRKSEKGWKVEGDPTEGALICAAAKAGLDYDALEKKLPRVDSVPFESQYQYMATLHKSSTQQSCPVYLKGSVESILPRCSTRMDASGQSVSIDTKEIQSQGEQLATQGLRVLAFARTERPAGTKTIDHPDVESGLTFLGLQGMIDPPRQEAIDAVEACHEAGIQVKMITGDHAVTATAIAKKIGLSTEEKPSVVTGKALTEMSDHDLAEQIQETAVFARVSPDQKLRLVKALQSKGHVVAMTGDGVNDAPALRQADIGVAMGKAGTEVAREAGDMILTDDNFASIEAAVEEGRGVFDNLTKFIVWTLPTNLGEGLIILAAVFAGATLPILPVQILWINMSTAILLGMMLAFEPKEKGIMTRPPRGPKMPILTRHLGLRIILVGTLMLIGGFSLFNYERWQGSGESVARTVAVNVFVMVELFYLFNCRSLKGHWLAQGLLSNPWLYIGVTSMIGLQMLFTYVPFMNHLFSSAAIGFMAWVRIIAVALAVHIIVTLEKAFWWKLSNTYKNR